MPVDFSPKQRASLLFAARKAGIKPAKLISEPTAAYIHCFPEVRGFTNVAVFDWGGGTLDVSILRHSNHEVTELAVGGRQLGGDDIDERVARKLHALAAAQYPGLAAFDDMPAACRDDIINRSESAKLALSNDDYTYVRLLKYGAISSANIQITEQAFSEWIRPDLSDAATVLHEALRLAHLTAAGLDALIMVGGSSGIHAIQHVLDEEFGARGVAIIRPDNGQWAVASGAARSLAADTAYHLGQDICVLQADDTRYPLIQRGAPVPFQSEELRFNMVDDAGSAHIPIVDENGPTVGGVGRTSKGIYRGTDQDSRANHRGYAVKSRCRQHLAKAAADTDGCE